MSYEWQDEREERDSEGHFLRSEIHKLREEIKALKKFNGLLMEKNELLEKQLQFEKNKNRNKVSFKGRLHPEKGSFKRLSSRSRKKRKQMNFKGSRLGPGARHSNERV